MELLSTLAIVVIAVSIVIVWVFRFDNIVKEFKEYGLSDLTRNMVGAAKISISTLLVAGIWYPALVPVPALLMAGLMICAQIAHISVKNPFHKFLPSLCLLLLSLFVAAVHLEMI
ncbi:DoxX family protein [Croceiramulus getboli]|nr:DoxX family protein [Flavobacteriaceae bacterium YJPT1-3]